MAKVIDLLIIEILLAACSLLLSNWVVIGLRGLAWALIDRMGRGQSPGKWLLGLHTVEFIGGTRISLYNGFVRNFSLILLATGVSMNLWWASALVTIPTTLAVILEVYFIFNVRSGLRVGDVLGTTRVADFKDEHTKFIEQFLKEEDAI